MMNQSALSKAVRNSIRGIALAGVAALGLASAANASAACTGGSTLTGTYGLRVAGGSYQVTTEKYLNGTLTFNGACALTGYVSIGEYNTVVDFAPVTGSYTTLADNTITISLNIPGESFPETYQVGYSPLLGEAVGIETDNSSVASIDLKAQVFNPTTPQAPFTNASLKGTWAASCGGYTGGNSDLDYFTFDGSKANYGTFGNFSGVDYTNAADQFGINTYVGQYGVLPDGSFGGSLAVNGTVALGLFGSIDNNGNEIQFSYQFPNRVFDSCVAKRVK